MGHLLGGWGQEAQVASPALPLTHCDLGPVAPRSGPPCPPSPRQGFSKPLLEAGTAVSPSGDHEGVLELPMGYAQHRAGQGTEGVRRALLALLPWEEAGEGS